MIYKLHSPYETDFLPAIRSLDQATLDHQIKDEKGKGIILARLHRLMEGLPSDVTPLGQGLSELRIHYGPGYRVYFHQRGNTLIILLCGGDKGTQKRDIEIAREILNEWRTQNG